uniref:GDP-mannose 4,6-dehydratase n=1 Tax=Pithovirus LCPAC304 TaxID=2506594 RepID=A0A481Z7I5_9VIRU|nr:MAG: GDP-mannose 4,6 dehydratase [Pithovirus LCPAC304]
MERIALISGITGQDGSYLAELLLLKGYFVWGITRKTSQPIERSHIGSLVGTKTLTLRYGDLADGRCLSNVLRDIEHAHPAMDRLEVYNLGALTHVKLSFDLPEYCANVNGLGTLRFLEAIRMCGYSDKIRFYQASTSELFGKVVETPQNETTPFYPRSPYGVSKLFAFWTTKNYREAYGLYACNGILFNHETLAGFMPLLFKQGDIIDIKPISEIVKYHTRKEGVLVNESKNVYQEGRVETNLEVWDDNEWTKVTFASGYPHNVKNDNKNPRFIISKNAAYFTTGSHVIIMEDGSEKKAEDIRLEDKVKLVNYPKVTGTVSHVFKKQTNYELECKYCNHIFSNKNKLNIHIGKCQQKTNFLLLPTDEDEAEFIGLMVGDGTISGITPRFYNTSTPLVDYVIRLWERIGKRNGLETKSRVWIGKSGFNPEKEVMQLNLSGFPGFFRKYKIYNEDKTKRVPYQVLNADASIMLKFLEGYNKADGLKANKCIYLFKNFKTNSACLAQGLLYLVKQTTGQDFNINVEFVDKPWGKKLYYSLNILSDSRYSTTQSVEKGRIVKSLLAQKISQRQISRETGISRTFIRKINNGYIPDGKHHKAKEANAVKKIISYDEYDGWFYDLKTESGTFHAGIGLGRIHNSPRRDAIFLTRKVTTALGNILRGTQDTVVLGNLDAMRDWGHAKDFVQGMWLMLQQDTPDDFILSTNVCHTVREFVEKAFALKGFEIEWRGNGLDEIGYDVKYDRTLLTVSAEFFRPSEVDKLQGDNSKAVATLGWTPSHTFEDLIKDMVEADCA